MQWIKQITKCMSSETKPMKFIITISCYSSCNATHSFPAISEPRKSVTGHPLPSPRLVSTTIHWDIDLAHHVHTLMIMQFGQFLDHDLSRTAITKLSKHPSGRGRHSFMQSFLALSPPKSSTIFISLTL